MFSSTRSRMPSCPRLVFEPNCKIPRYILHSQFSHFRAGPTPASATSRMRSKCSCDHSLLRCTMCSPKCSTRRNFEGKQSTIVTHHFASFLHSFAFIYLL